MGRFVDLVGEIASIAEEGPDGLFLSPDAWERFTDDYTEDEIEDALQVCRESLFQTELVEAADTLSARLVEILGAYGDEALYARAERGEAALTIDMLAQLSRRVSRLEDILGEFREGALPDRRGFDALQRRLADHGIEPEMQAAREEDERMLPEDEDEDE
jgi:hypothetical protein